MKKKIRLFISVAVLLALLSGCAHISQEEKQSGIPYDDLTKDKQMMENQGEADGEKIQNETVLLDETLDEDSCGTYDAGQDALCVCGAFKKI